MNSAIVSTSLGSCVLGAIKSAVVAVSLLGTVATSDGPPTQYFGTVSAYCDRGVMSDGQQTHAGVAAGASWIPLGSVVAVDGWGSVVIEDRGRPGLFSVDLWMPTCWQAWQWGRRFVPYQILRYGWRWSIFG